MRIRQFIAALIVLLSLSAQAGTLFACGMMPGAAPTQNCCPADGKGQCPPGMSGLHGCALVAPSDALLAHAMPDSYGKHHSPLHPIDPPPVAAVAFHLLPASFDAGGRRHLAPQFGAVRRRTFPLYLQTARLRL